MNIRIAKTAGNTGVWMHSIKPTLAFTLMLGVAALAAGPTPVILGTSGSFAVLAETGVSTTGVTAITGDIGVSPVAATYVTGFGLIKDASGTFSTSSLVTGKIYASDYTDPTPTKMTTAIGDMGKAYTNAAGRLSPDYTELYAGDLTGKTLIPGLYKWGTGVLVSAGGVTISGSSTDVWIFQIAQNLALANGAMVTLSGGAQASNIFWQVAGKVTLGTTAAMKGIILCQTEVAMGTGATLSGRALAQTAVTLEANAITGPAVSVVENVSAPVHHGFALSQALSEKSIEFTVPSTGMARLTIVNTLGQEVATLFNGEAEAGKHNQARFNSMDLARGSYYSRLEFNGQAEVATIQVVK